MGESGTKQSADVAVLCSRLARQSKAPASRDTAQRLEDNKALIARLSTQLSVLASQHSFEWHRASYTAASTLLDHVLPNWPDQARIKARPVVDQLFNTAVAPSALLLCARHRLNSSS